ncbi:hypothetical protein OG905_01355 [Streptomyces sp. NBC_00322]|uniref:hypothetical protein n=1 Tax=Streptomyces sp. NBC_00322 TaxID=2975712 RepID=UPI002E2ACF98|nr:hypothetical protein [Streptomyces sp. NBC_00322]
MTGIEGNLHDHNSHDLSRVRGSLSIGSESRLEAKFTTRDRSAVFWRGMYVNDGLIGSSTFKRRAGAESTPQWGRRPPEAQDAAEPYLAEPRDVSEILTASRKPTPD